MVNSLRMTAILAGDDFNLIWQTCQPATGADHDNTAKAFDEMNREMLVWTICCVKSRCEYSAMATHCANTMRLDSDAHRYIEKSGV